MANLTLLQIFCILLSSLLVNNVQSSSEGSYFFYQQPVYPRDCQEVFQQCSTNNASGVYLIKPDGYGQALEVYCDNQVDGGGWTFFQRRNEDNVVEFGRTFSKYRESFGFLSGEFWLGNEKLSFLTNQKRYQLRIDMTNSAGSSFYVTYDLFRISDEWSNYKLTSVGQYGGNAALDNMARHGGQEFATPDHDNKAHPAVNCADHYDAGWWFFGNCFHANLNAVYGGYFFELYNHYTYYDLRYSQMKIRPI